MVRDSDLSKSGEPGGPADDDEDLNKQRKFISGALTYERRIYVLGDALLHDNVISLFHDHRGSNHFRALRTAELVSRDIYWPGLDATIRKFLAGWEVCDRIQALRHGHHGLSMPLLPPSEPCQGITMDFGTDLPESTASGYTNITLIVDRLSKMAIYLPYGGDIDSPELARMVSVHVIRKDGIPDNFITDHGPQFTSRFCDQYAPI